MQKRNFLPIFLLFLFLSVVLLFLSHTPFFGWTNGISSPVFTGEGMLFRFVHLPSGLLVNKDLTHLQEENLALHSQLVHLQQIQQDNIALNDQFQTTTIPSSNLLPARIIGDPQFIPGVSAPETLIIDKGTNDEVAVGDVVVYKNNVVGTISQVAAAASQITVITNKTISFTAKASSTNAQGVLSGQGNGGMVLGNVVLSDSLKIGDTVVTAGSQNISGVGFPPGLIVGKIVSLDKNPSSLYQSASVQSLLSFSKLSIVFIIK